MPEKRTISAKEVAADINAGMTDEEVCAKYRLSSGSLRTLKDKLRGRGFLSGTTGDVRLAVTPSVAITDKRALARAIADTVKEGASDRRVIERFHIAPSKLPNIYATLIRAGFLTQEEVDRRSSVAEADPTPPGPQFPVQAAESASPNPESEPKGDTAERAAGEPPDVSGQTGIADEHSTPTDSSEKNRPELPASFTPASKAPAEELTFNWVCPNCGKMRAEEPEFCPECGAAAAEANAVIPTVENPAAPKFSADQRPSEDHEKSAAAPDSYIGAPRPTPVMTAPYHFDSMQYLREGYRIFKEAPTMFVGFTAIFLGLNLLSGGVINLFVGFVSAGYFVVSFKIIRREPFVFSDFFSGFNFFGPILLSGLLVSLLTTVGFLLCLVLGMYLSLAFGLLLCLVPGMYLSLAYGFVVPLILTRKMGAWEAMEASRRIITNGFWSFAVLASLLLLINLGGFLVCGIGLLATLPIGWCAMAAAYDDLAGVADEDEFIRL